MKRKALMFLIVYGITMTVFANNITISNPTLTGRNSANHYIMVQFDLSWENSWRTTSSPSNWDAAWVFVKYRVPVSSGGDGFWHHASLNNTGHTAPSGSLLDVGLLTPATAFSASTNPGVGAFVLRNADGSGTFSKTGIQLQWNYDVNYKTGTTPIGDMDIAEIAVYAIEMVNVPQGAFYLGSGGSETGSFTNGSWTSGATIPLAITGETALTVAHSTGNLWYESVSTGDQQGPVPASFPKGYDPFYCMKYEISQQEYVDFLNSLTAAQATARFPGQTIARHGIVQNGSVFSTSLPMWPAAGYQ